MADAPARRPRGRLGLGWRRPAGRRGGPPDFSFAPSSARGRRSSRLLGRARRFRLAARARGPHRLDAGRAPALRGPGWGQDPGHARGAAGRGRQGARPAGRQRPISDGRPGPGAALCLGGHRFDRHRHAPARRHPAGAGQPDPGRPGSRRAPLGGREAGQFREGAISPGPARPGWRWKPTAEVRKALEEGIALLQLGDPDPAVKIAAIDRLAELQAVGSLDNLQARGRRSGPAEAVAAAANRAIARPSTATSRRSISSEPFFAASARAPSCSSWRWAWPSPSA